MQPKNVTMRGTARRTTALRTAVWTPRSAAVLRSAQPDTCKVPVAYKVPYVDEATRRRRFR
eukprot:6179213-Pleurochrysis_carterae.AAC.1